MYFHYHWSATWHISLSGLNCTRLVSMPLSFLCINKTRVPFRSVDDPWGHASAGVTDVGSPYTNQNTSVRFRSFDDPWGHTTDCHGVTVVGSAYTEQNTSVRLCLIQVIRRPMHGVTPLTGVTDMGSRYTHQKTRVRLKSVDDPWGHTTDWR